MAKGPRIIAPQVIDLIKFPHSLEEWDVIGIQTIPKAVAQIIVGSSKTPIAKFKVDGDKPVMRALVCKIMYDAQRDDAIIGVYVMPFAPHNKGLRIDNNPKNLMLSKEPDVEPMGLDTRLNWRLNYTPFYLETNEPYFGVEANKIVKFGSAKELASLIIGQIEKLGADGSLHTMDILDLGTRRATRGHDVQRYEGYLQDVSKRKKLVDGDEDQRVLAEITRQRQNEAQTKKRTEAKARMQEQRSTPSGRLAFSLHLPFNEASNRDITLENAHSLGLLTEDQYLRFDALGEKYGADTLRTVYDLFRDKHEEVQAEIIKADLCEAKDVIGFKAGLEQELKDALVGYFRVLQNGSVENRDKKQDYIDNSTGYKPQLT